MATLTAYSSGDGYPQKGDADYTTAQTASECDDVGNLQDFLLLGQNISGGTYYIGRVALLFDTSALPDTCAITAATITCYCQTTYIVGNNFDMVLVSGAGITSPLVVGDYGDLLTATAAFANNVNTSGINDNDPIVFTLNASGLASISKTGITAFGIRHEDDIAASAPIQREDIAIWSSRETEVPDYRPKLVVTYSAFIPQVMIMRKYR